MNNPRQSDKLKKQNDFLYKTHRGNIALNRTSSARLKYCVCCFKKHLLRCLVPVISLAVSVSVGVECDLTVAWPGLAGPVLCSTESVDTEDNLLVTEGSLPCSLLTDVT